VQQQHDHQGPCLLLEAASARATAVRGQWLVAWRLQNLGQEPIEVLFIWLPHDKFFSGQQTSNPPLRLLPQESTLLELQVVCHEPPGSVVETPSLFFGCSGESSPGASLYGIGWCWIPPARRSTSAKQSQSNGWAFPPAAALAHPSRCERGTTPLRWARHETDDWGRCR
jgi:hypothetical protein